MVNYDRRFNNLVERKKESSIFTYFKICLLIETKKFLENIFFY